MGKGGYPAQCRLQAVCNASLPRSKRGRVRYQYGVLDAPLCRRLDSGRPSAAAQSPRRSCT